MRCLDSQTNAFYLYISSRSCWYVMWRIICGLHTIIIIFLIPDNLSSPPETRDAVARGWAEASNTIVRQSEHWLATNATAMKQNYSPATRSDLIPVIYYINDNALWIPHSAKRYSIFIQFDKKGQQSVVLMLGLDRSILVDSSSKESVIDSS